MKSRIFESRGVKRVSLLLWVVWGSLLMLPSLIWAQCPNLNFSMGNLTNWQCYAGSCSSGNYYSAPTAPMPGKHTIMNLLTLTNSGQLMDENCNKIPKVPDGYSYSLRLGNSGTGAETEAVEYTMTVDSNSSLLILSFAWVMENPGHLQSDQPHFTMKVTDENGTILPVPCSNINFTAGDNMVGLACETGSLVARNWTTVGFSLESIIGQKIKIFFETWDCTLSGHFGYAYLVGECRPMKIDLTFCEGSTVARLRAPEGFDSYTWTRTMQPGWVRNDRIISITDPWDGEEFICTVRSELGCESTLRTVIAKTSIDANFYHGVKDETGYVPLAENYWISWYDTCTRTATFVERVNVYNSTKGGIEWEIQQIPNVHEYDSLFTYTFPDPPTDMPVTYNVRLTAYAENGCIDTSRSEWKYITIYPSPKVKITGSDMLCNGDTANLIATSIRSKFVSHEWSWVKSNGDIGYYIGDTLKINKSGRYCLASLDTSGCYAYDSIYVETPHAQFNNLTINNVNCWGDATGRFSYSAFLGGVEPYQYAEWIVWLNGKMDTINVSANPISGRFFLDLPAGTYTFFAKDVLGCEYRDTVHVLPFDSLRISAMAEKTSCAKDNGEIAFEVVGGASPYSVSVSGPVNRVANNTTTITNLPQGLYTAKILDSDNCESEEIEVEIFALPQYTITGKITCNGNPLNGVSIETNSSIHICNSASTDMFGEYSLSVDSATAVELTPMLAGYVFLPASCTYFVTEDLFDVHFIASSTVGIAEISYELQVTSYKLRDL